MPSLQPAGHDLTLQALPNGQLDAVWGADGNPLFDDTEVYAVNSLLDSRVGEWFADASGKRGSRIHEIRDDRGNITISRLESAVLAALQPLSNAGRIYELTTKAANLGGGRYLVRVNWKTRSGQPQALARSLEF